MGSLWFWDPVGVADKLDLNTFLCKEICTLGTAAQILRISYQWNMKIPLNAYALRCVSMKTYKGKCQSVANSNLIIIFDNKTEQTISLTISSLMHRIKLISLDNVLFETVLQKPNITRPAIPQISHGSPNRHIQTLLVSH